MQLPSPKVMAINAGVLLVLGAGAVSLVRHWIYKPELTACSERYTKRTTLNVQPNGTLMTPSDLQATLSGRDMMVLENLSFTAVNNGPAPAAMTISLKAGTSQVDNERAEPGGVRFPWQPRTLPKGVASACLTYNVYLPADFNFDNAGTLPGLFGTSPRLGAADSERFNTNVIWQSRGTFGNSLFATARGKQLTERSDHDRREPLPRGRWFKVDQEVKLNTPGASDGFVRLWVNGALRSRLEQATLRRSADTFVEGVMADVYFGGQDFEGQRPEGRAQKNETISLTPFQLRWN